MKCKAHPFYSELIGYSDGRIYSVKRNLFLTQTNNAQGYPIVTARNKTLYVHRIIAECLILNDHGYPVINHINGIKSDNRVENLEWCTRAMNVQHAFKTGLMKNNNLLNGRFPENNNRGDRAVDQYTLDGNFLATYKNMAVAASSTGLSKSQIYRVCANKNKRISNFKWQYSQG